MMCYSMKAKQLFPTMKGTASIQAALDSVEILTDEQAAFLLMLGTEAKKKEMISKETYCEFHATVRKKCKQKEN